MATTAVPRQNTITSAKCRDVNLSIVASRGSVGSYSTGTLLPTFGVKDEDLDGTNVTVSPFAVVNDMRGEKVGLGLSPLSFSRRMSSTMVPSARKQRRYRARFATKLKAENAAASSATAKTGGSIVTGLREALSNLGCGIDWN